jgi:hypothetical protein
MGLLNPSSVVQPFPRKSLDERVPVFRKKSHEPLCVLLGQAPNLIAQRNKLTSLAFIVFNGFSLSLANSASEITLRNEVCIGPHGKCARHHAP